MLEGPSHIFRALANRQASSRQSICERAVLAERGATGILPS